MDDIANVNEPLKSLQRAHMHFQHRVDAFAEHIEIPERQRTSANSAEKTIDDEISARLLFFAGDNANEALRAGQPEIMKNRPILCPGISLKQVLLGQSLPTVLLRSLWYCCVAFQPKRPFNAQRSLLNSTRSILIPEYLLGFTFFSILTIIFVKHLEFLWINARMASFALEEAINPL